MKILIIADRLPMFDRASGDLRLFNILQVLAKRYEVFFHAVYFKCQVARWSTEEAMRYKERLENLGIVVVQDLKRLRIQKRFNVVFIEFYSVARRHLHECRFWQPQARIIIDSVDVHFHRFYTKAKLTKNINDFAKAAKIKKNEMGIYKLADMIIAVTGKDKEVLLEENKDLCVEEIPNIHETGKFQSIDKRIPNSLVFVGGFNHPPNIDGMLYFCTDVFPIIKTKIPDVRLTIVGSDPPKSVTNLACDNIEVTGFVNDVKQYLEAAYISVAPLRYGAGMKGKIGEALSFGLPVVTTDIGIEGFGLTPGKDVLVGNNAQEFASAVISLCREKFLYNKISENGWLFMKTNYHREVVEDKIYQVFENVKNYKLNTFLIVLSASNYFIKGVKGKLNKYLFHKSRNDE